MMILIDSDDTACNFFCLPLPCTNCWYFVVDVILVFLDDENYVKILLNSWIAKFLKKISFIRESKTIIKHIHSLRSNTQYDKAKEKSSKNMHCVHRNRIKISLCLLLFSIWWHQVYTQDETIKLNSCSKEGKLWWFILRYVCVSHAMKIKREL